MKTSLILVLTLLILITINTDLKSQHYPGDFNCVTFDIGETYENPSDPFQGWIKPNRTDLSGGLPAPDDSHFSVLVVFVQFLGEAPAVDGSWPTNQEPEYLSNLIAINKSTTGGNWWNYYNKETEMLSSHWMEISRGKFHVIGDAYSVGVPMTAQEYWTASGQNFSVAESMINNDIWNDLIQQDLTDWRKFDRWKEVNDIFYYTPYGLGDGFVDMIYKVHKSTGGILYPAEGYNMLGPYSTAPYYDIVDPEHNIKIKYKNTDVSGITLSFLGRLSKYIGALGHEHGHHLFMLGHVTYSRVSFGLGPDGFYSPYDMILNEYMSPYNAVFGEENYLGDYSSRNSGDGELIKVPIQGDEFFLLANRTKVSKWDRVMLGDTTMYNYYDDNSDYGKGLYIYHIENGIDFLYGDNNPQDIECADGFWNWEHTGYGNVYLNCWTGPGFYFFDKTTVNYDNDESLLNTTNLTGDGLSLHYYLYTTPPPQNKKVSTPKRLDWGKIAVDNCHLGTTQFHTNATEWYSDFEHMGDRWDA